MRLDAADDQPVRRRDVRRRLRRELQRQRRRGLRRQGRRSRHRAATTATTTIPSAIVRPTSIPSPIRPTAAATASGKRGTPEEHTNFARPGPLCPMQRCGDGIDESCQRQRDTTCVVDADCDGYPATVNSRPYDCDDDDPASHPGAVEACGSTKDLNCNGIDRRRLRALRSRRRRLPAHRRAQQLPRRQRQAPGHVRLQRLRLRRLPRRDRRRRAAPRAASSVGRLAAALRGFCRGIYEPKALTRHRQDQRRSAGWSATPTATASRTKAAPRRSIRLRHRRRRLARRRHDRQELQPEQRHARLRRQRSHHLPGGAGQLQGEPATCKKTARHRARPTAPATATVTATAPPADCDDNDRRGASVGGRAVRRHRQRLRRPHRRRQPRSVGRAAGRRGRDHRLHRLERRRVRQAARAPACARSPRPSRRCSGSRRAAHGLLGETRRSSRPAASAPASPSRRPATRRRRRTTTATGASTIPTARNLAVKGMPCGINVGQCKAGIVVGCDMSQTELLHQFGRARRRPAWYRARRRRRSDTVCPVAELCNGLDDDCDGSWPDRDHAVARLPSTTSSITTATSTSPAPAARPTLAPGILGCYDCDDAQPASTRARPRSATASTTRARSSPVRRSSTARTTAARAPTRPRRRAAAATAAATRPATSCSAATARRCVPRPTPIAATCPPARAAPAARPRGRAHLHGRHVHQGAGRDLLGQHRVHAASGAGRGPLHRRPLLRAARHVGELRHLPRVHRRRRHLRQSNPAGLPGNNCPDGSGNTVCNGAGACKKSPANRAHPAPSATTASAPTATAATWRAAVSARRATRRAGACTQVVGAPVTGGSPPRSACTATDASCAGSCEAPNQNACTYPTSSTVCPNACVPGSGSTPARVQARVCNSAGACTATGTSACSSDPTRSSATRSAPTASRTALPTRLHQWRLLLERQRRHLHGAPLERHHLRARRLQLGGLRLLPRGVGLPRQRSVLRAGVPRADLHGRARRQHLRRCTTSAPAAAPACARPPTRAATDFCAPRRRHARRRHARPMPTATSCTIVAMTARVRPPASRRRGRATARWRAVRRASAACRATTRRTLVLRQNSLAGGGCELD